MFFSPTFIAKWTLWFYFRVALRCFFRDIQAEGTENVPDHGSIMLLANHNNAFVDPLLIRLMLAKEITITAKSPLAARPLFAPLMRLARVVTFHRAQDKQGVFVGKKLAMEDFAICHERLVLEEPLCIFPEGISHEDPKMRPFKSGTGKIALDFIAKEKQRELFIVPVGLNFDAKEHFRSRVYLGFGEALNVRTWLNQHPDATPRSLMAEMRHRIANLIAELPTRREVLVLRWASRLLVNHQDNQLPFWHSKTEFSKIIKTTVVLRDSMLSETILYRQIRSFRIQLGRYGLNPEDVFLSQNPFCIFVTGLLALVMFVLCAPLLIWGIVMNAIPAIINTFLTYRYSHLPDLWASNAVFFGLLCFPIAYTIQILVASFLLPWIWVAVYALSLPVSGYFALRYFDLLRSQVHEVKALWVLRNHQLHAELRTQAETLIHELHQFLKIHNESVS